ncbi:MAG TPA: hypothetical protein ENJ31_01220 [Anaerolineae bacterium]|nr:hypothetical protein [Anaerolineae bacterium]
MPEEPTAIVAGPVDVPRLPTGILTLDLALDGGLPWGNIVEIGGKPHSGKTTLTLQILGQAQRAGATAMYIGGASLPPTRYLAACGVDAEALYIPNAADTTCLEAALKVAVQALAGGNTVVALDPLPAFPGRDEWEVGMENGNRQKIRAQALDVAYALASAHLRRRPDGLLLIVNQERYNTGVLFGNPWEPTVHEVTDHFPVRLDLARIQAIKWEGRIIGSRSRVRIKKHAGGTPFREAEFDILTHRGPDLWANVLDLALIYDVIVRENGNYLLDGKPVGRTRAEVKATLAARYRDYRRLIEHLQLPQLLRQTT